MKISTAIAESNSLTSFLDALNCPVPRDVPINLSVNSTGKVQVAIQQQGHWFNQLHTAYQTARGKYDEVCIGYENIQNLDTKIQTLTQRFDWETSGWVSIWLSLRGDPNRWKRTADEITRTEQHRQSVLKMTQDALAEKNTAEAFIDKICADHADELAQGYESVQKNVSEAAIIAKLSDEIAVGLLKSFGYPEEVVRSLLMLSPEQQRQALEAAQETVGQLANSISTVFPPPSQVFGGDNVIVLPEMNGSEETASWPSTTP